MLFGGDMGLMRVLVPVDTDIDRAIAAARAILSIPNAADAVEVTVLNVQEKTEITGDDIGSVRSDELYDPEHMPPSVTEVESFFEDEGISVDIRREHANPAESIVGTAQEIDADRIVMATRKRSPVGKALFGSVTQSAVLNSPVPVTIVTETTN